jgi:hypothetical protein
LTDNSFNLVITGSVYLPGLLVHFEFPENAPFDKFLCFSHANIARRGFKIGLGGKRKLFSRDINYF